MSEKPTPQEAELGKFFGLCANAGEQFGDYLIAVRMKDGGYAYRSSEKNWGMGAAVRIAQEFKTKDDIGNWEEFQSRLEDCD